MSINWSRLTVATLFGATCFISSFSMADDQHGKAQGQEDYKQFEHNPKISKDDYKKAHQKAYEKALTEGKVLPRVKHAKWEAECSTCHNLFHPGLLPARSWEKIMTGLDKHFGENASLDKPTQEEITKFLVTNSAEQSKNKRSEKILSSIPANSTPLRITEVPFIKKKHEEVPNHVFKREKVGARSNCVACHQTADLGYFSEKTVVIPK